MAENCNITKSNTFSDENVKTPDSNKFEGSENENKKTIFNQPIVQVIQKNRAKSLEAQLQVES